jgi:hypothetical protein
MLNVNVLYNAQEYMFEVDKSSLFAYEQLCEEIKKKLEFNEQDGNLKLMTINTQERFVFLVEDYFSNIINESFPENTLKLCASMIKEKSIKEILYQNGNNDEEQNNDDEDDDFEIKADDTDDKTGVDNNDNNNDSNKLNQNTNNKNNIIDYINNDDENKKEEKEDIKQNPIEQNENNNNNDNIINTEEQSSDDKLNNKENNPKEILFPNINNDNNNNIKTNIKHKDLSHFNIENINQQPNSISHTTTSFSQETCDICNNPLQNIKYICLLCDSLTICTFCEKDHPHSVIKYKTHFLSDISRTYAFIHSKQPSIKNNKSFINDLLTKKEKDISLENEFDSFISMRPNKEVRIPIIIHNNSKGIISSKDFTLIVKNYKKVNMIFDFPTKNVVIEPGNFLLVFLICQSQFQCTEEKIWVELYSKEFQVKQSSKSSLRLVINVNEDGEDEQLAKIFNAYPKIQALKKEYKSMILTLMNDNLTSKSPNEIYDILKKYKWNVNRAFDKLNDKHI